METKQVAEEFTRLCKEGRLEEAGDRFWSDDIVSIEAMDGPMARCSGRKAVDAKGAWWTENHTVHSFATEGPYVNGDQFALQFTMDVTAKAGDQAGQRWQMTEVGLYAVRGGKIVEERFFY